MSDLEIDFFYFLEYSDYVVDIREQFPLLHLEQTISISNELGIEHPKNPNTQEYIIMTTDFLVTSKISDKFVDNARTIKNHEELKSKRVLEKFEIESIYWKQKGID
ncbi:MAG: transposase protein [Haloplasmataceae bacterium]|jgi:hypothetical protein|nr:transposase protein [Haloplasmataceae bacterium]